MNHPPSLTATRSRTTIRPLPAAAVLLTGAAVALSLGLYARLHSPARKPLFLLGFSGMLQMKAWLSTAALFFVLVQVITALWMWERLPGKPAAPQWLGDAHRWSGAIAFVLTLPVAVHCIWSLGFVTTTPRVLLHSVAGCLFYGAYASKMVGLRIRGLPGWALPVLGGTVFSLFIVLWLSASLWLFTRHGIPLT
jgi:Family of unknown function (DUF6529)